MLLQILYQLLGSLKYILIAAIAATEHRDCRLSKLHAAQKIQSLDLGRSWVRQTWLPVHATLVLSAERLQPLLHERPRTLPFQQLGAAGRGT